MLAGIPESQTAYSVEVSGWDNNEDFFVEKTELHWSEQSGKHILLLRPIASGALVFLRMLDDTAAFYDQRRRVKALEEQLLKDLEFHGIVGKSPVMLEVFDFARKVARH